MVQKFCQIIVDLTASEKTLLTVIIIQFMWMIIGSLTRLDPFPFLGMLTISNVLQLILIFVLAVAQRTNNATIHSKVDSLHENHTDLHSKIDSLKKIIKPRNIR